MYNVNVNHYVNAVLNELKYENQTYLCNLNTVILDTLTHLVGTYGIVVSRICMYTRVQCWYIRIILFVGCN